MTMPVTALRSPTGLSGLTLGLLLATAAAAQTSAPPAASGALAERQVRVWSATCAACHGEGGRGQGAIPPIVGRDAQGLYRTLLEFKNGQRPAATVMHQHAKAYTDDELLRIAQFYAPGPRP